MPTKTRAPIRGGLVGACLVGALGCGQGPADGDFSRSGSELIGDRDSDIEARNSEPEGRASLEKLRVDSVDGEAFARIWGTSDDLWVLGGPARPVVENSVGAPAIALCGPDRWRADVVVRRNVGDEWLDMAVPARTSLVSLHGTDGNNVWLVGLDGAVVQFDGQHWIEHDVRGAAGLEFQEADDACSELSLRSVFARSASDVWVVGHIFPSSLGPGLILHFDGTRWERQPSGAGDGMFGVWAATATDAWAVGSTGLAYRFDGTFWSQVDAKTSQYLYSVWGTSAEDVWAAGNLAVTTRFDGAQWQLVQPEHPYAQVHALTGDATAGLWSLGTTHAADFSIIRQTLSRWTEAGWQEQASLTDPADMLGGIWVTPEGQLWGAGQSIVRLR